MATAAEHEYEETRNGLADAIRGVQSDSVPHEVARNVLTYDVPNHTHVIGVTRAGNALFFHCRDQYIVSVPIDVEGLTDGGPIRAEWKEGQSSNVAEWVWKRRDWWEWVHPRYQWR